MVQHIRSDFFRWNIFQGAHFYKKNLEKSLIVISTEFFDQSVDLLAQGVEDFFERPDSVVGLRQDLVAGRHLLQDDRLGRQQDALVHHFDLKQRND